jgi:hypothetical protein
MVFRTSANKIEFSSFLMAGLKLKIPKNRVVIVVHRHPYFQVWASGTGTVKDYEDHGILIEFENLPGALALQLAGKKPQPTLGAVC